MTGRIGMKRKHILLTGLIMIAFFVLAIISIIKSKDTIKIEKQFKNNIISNDSDPKKSELRFKFEFITSQTQDGIFIETSEEQYDYEIQRTLEKKGLKVPRDQKILKVDSFPFI